MIDYITSDIHTYHKKILDFCPETRPYDSLEQMHEDYIGKINDILSDPSNHLYILGDFSFKGKEATKKILDQLPCKQITLVLGNHDKHHRKLYEEYFYRVEDYLEVNVRYDGMDDKVKVCMFHFPIEQGEWNRASYGGIMCHGHLHGQFKTGSRRRDVGIDGQGRFYTLQEVVEDCLKDDIIKTHHAD